MEDIIQKICRLRGYDMGEKIRAPDGEEVFFYYAPIFDQDFLNKIFPASARAHLIVLYDKQKKLKTSFEEIKSIEMIHIPAIHLALIPNKFRPKHEKLRGEELATMRKFAEKLPILQATDPMSTVYGFRAGDIVKIYRLDGSIYFRRVV